MEKTTNDKKNKLLYSDIATNFQRTSSETGLQGQLDQISTNTMTILSGFESEDMFETCDQLEEYVVCNLCGTLVENLNRHIKEDHGRDNVNGKYILCGNGCL